MGGTRFHLERLDTRVGPVASVTIANESSGSRPNTFGEAALQSLEDVLGRLRTRDWRGLLLTGSAGSFGAGADIDEFPEISPERAREGSRAGHELFGRLHGLPFLTIAAINGGALGGGLELALHCDLRTIGADVRHVGFPEVFLGLIPAWGGTQLAPRLVGAEAAVRLVVENPLRQNRMIGAEEALAIGLVDHVVPTEELLDRSLELLLEAIEAGGGKRRPAANLADVAAVVRRARARVDDVVHGQAPAPYRALELLEGAAAWSLEEGYRAEEDAVAELLPGPRGAGVALRLRRRRAPPRAVGRPPRRRAAADRAGRDCRRRADGDTARNAVRAAAPGAGRPDRRRSASGRRTPSRRSARSWTGFVARGRLADDDAEALRPLAVAGEGMDAYSGCGLVLEAVFEELGAKREVFAALEAVVSPDCVLATNTSALSVSAMAAGLDHPERVVGLHFFNPVPVLPLVEIVRTDATDDQTLATAWDVVRRLRKRGVVVGDAPGFVVNRLLTRQSTVLMQALDRGATFEETDEAALRLGLPMPPSALLAMVGPRVANDVLLTLNEAWPDRFPRSPVLQALADGEFPTLEARDDRPSVDEIYEQLLEGLADEARRILDEGVVPSAAELDACLILGAGFPFFRGGITPYLDRAGVSQRVSGLPLGGV